MVQLCNALYKSLSCSQVGHRDFSAAENLLEVLTCILEGRPRPERMRRQGPAPWRTAISVDDPLRNTAASQSARQKALVENLEERRQAIEESCLREEAEQQPAPPPSPPPNTSSRSTMLLLTALTRWGEQVPGDPGTVAAQTVRE